MSEQTRFDGVKIGDVVYDLRFGYGKVYWVGGSIFSVALPEVGKLIFYFDGTPQSTIRHERLLFWDKPEIIAPPRPKRKVKKEGWIALHQLASGTIIGGSVYEDKENIPTEPKPLAINRVAWEEFE